MSEEIQKPRPKHVEVPFWANIFKKKETQKSDIINILEKIPLFSSLGMREIRKMSLIVYERNYQAGEFLFKEGNPGAGMFIIKSGAVAIERVLESGESTRLTTLTTGDFFGELSLMNDAPRTASAKCNKNTTVLIFFRQDLFDIIEREPHLGSKILIELAKMLGDRLTESNTALLALKKEMEK
ncbi:cyclic nucleotide-binding domain-containing protein [Spirochaetota bacterium]